MADSYASLISESLALVGVEAPRCLANVSSTVGDLRFAITIDDETVGLISDPLVRVTVPSPSADIRVKTTGAAVRSIIDGTTTIEHLVRSRELEVFGALAAVSQGHAVLLDYVHGAIRSPSVPDLRTRFDALAGGAS